MSSDNALPAAPLDAYVTAKPDEPTFTLQGGDPLAEPLVQLWAHLARVRTGLLTGDADWIYPALKAACHPDSDLSGNEREVNNLLLRATAAEEVSWAMRDYCRGNTSSGKASPEIPAENSLDEKAR